MHYKSELSAKQLAMVESEFKSSKKDPVIAWLLWFFLAPFGGHRFYLGNTGYAVCMLLFGWITLFIWPLVDGFFINKRLKEINDELELQIIQKIKTLVKE